MARIVPIAISRNAPLEGEHRHTDSAFTLKSLETDTARVFSTFNSNPAMIQNTKYSESPFLLSFRTGKTTEIGEIWKSVLLYRCFIRITTDMQNWLYSGISHKIILSQASLFALANFVLYITALILFSSLHDTQSLAIMIFEMIFNICIIIDYSIQLYYLITIGKVYEEMLPFHYLICVLFYITVSLSVLQIAQTRQIYFSIALITGFGTCFLAWCFVIAILAITPLYIALGIIEAIIRMIVCKLVCPVEHDIVREYSYFLYRYFAGIYETDTCRICLAKFSENDKICIMKCHDSHIFHEPCIKNWLELNSFCPICRNEAAFI